MNTPLKFNRNKSPFLATVRLRVDQHFKYSGQSKNANAAMWAKTTIFLTGFIACYGLIMTDMLALWPMLFIAVALGMFKAFVGFNICHDAIHGSFSSNKTINAVFSTVFHFLGANPYVWSISHNVVHHNFTNIPGHDDDLEVAPGLIRLSEETPVKKIQRFQHWYAFPLYSLASLSWVFRKDYKKFFQQKIGQLASKHPRIEYFNLFFYKALYYFLFIVLPLLWLELTWWQFIIGYLAMHFAQGLTMGLVFQLAHVVEGTQFPAAPESGTMDEVWASHQMHTTANFATNSRAAAFFLGGLNQQIEHHLFPGICHIHYGAIGKIVKQTAAEYGIPYIENRTFAGALRSHFRMLKHFGVAQAA